MALERLDALKDKFADAIQSHDFESANSLTKDIQEVISGVHSVCAFRRVSPRKEIIISKPDFRTDQRLGKIVIRLVECATHLKESVLDCNLGEFARWVDRAHSRIYRLLERLDEIEEVGINTTHPDKRKVKTTEVLRENFQNWRQWVEEERSNQKDILVEDEGDVFGEVMDLLGRVSDGNDPGKSS